MFFRNMSRGQGLVRGQGRGRKTKKDFVLLVIHLHILVLMLVGVLVAMSQLKSKPAPVFSTLFGVPDDGTAKREARILMPQEEKSQPDTKPSPK